MTLSISWQLALFAPAHKWYDWLKSFVTGDGLSWLSKLLLQSGQIYYLWVIPQQWADINWNRIYSVMIDFSVCTVIFVYTPSMHSVWDGVFIPPTVTVAITMAYRLFRELKLGLLTGPVVEGAISDVVFRDIGNITEQYTGRTFAGNRHRQGATCFVGTSVDRKRISSWEMECSEWVTKCACWKLEMP
jgi:hypothetical protein